MKHDHLYVHAYEMIDIILERNLLTLENLQYLFDRYQDDLITIYGDHFRIHQITLSPELAEKLNVDYVKEITDNKSLKYDLYGNSAGGQLAHRFLLFKTNSNVSINFNNSIGFELSIFTTLHGAKFDVKS